MARFVAEAVTGKGKFLDRYYKRFMKRNRKLQGKVSKDDFAGAIADLDRGGRLCDGSVSKKRGSALKKRLAQRRQLFKHLKSHFSQAQ